MSQLNDLRRAAINRHREQLFGDSSLKLYSMTPEDGETEIVELTEDWKGHRVRPTTSGFADQDGGAWQFQIVADEDWSTSQSDFKEIVSLTVGGRRWKVTKVEEPIGESLVWKLRAEVQK
jgi:hypothetical protein